LNFNFSNSTGISFAGCTDGPCPKCGGELEVLDGTYDFIGQEAVRLLAGPETTLAALRKAAQVAADSQAAGESAEKTASRLAEILPSFKKLVANPLGKAAIGVALFALQYLGEKALDRYFDGAAEPALSAVQLEQVVKGAVEQALAARDAAAEKAGVAFPAQASPGRAMSEVPFPNSLSFLQRDFQERYLKRKAPHAGEGPGGPPG
jgi:hypothetical protein